MKIGKQNSSRGRKKDGVLRFIASNGMVAAYRMVDHEDDDSR